MGADFITLLWFNTSFCSLYLHKCGLWYFKTQLTYFIHEVPGILVSRLLRGNQEIIKHLAGMWFTTLLYCFRSNKCLCWPQSKHASSLGFCDRFRGGWKVLSWQLKAQRLHILYSAYFMQISLENDFSRTERMIEVTDKIKACVIDMGLYL